MKFIISMLPPSAPLLAFLAAAAGCGNQSGVTLRHPVQGPVGGSSSGQDSVTNQNSGSKPPADGEHKSPESSEKPPMPEDAASGGGVVADQKPDNSAPSSPVAPEFPLCPQAKTGFSFVDIIEKGTPLKTVSSENKFTEGPLWLPDGYLIFSDISANRIMKITDSGNTVTFRADSGRANGNALDGSGRIYTAVQAQHAIFIQEKNGALKTLASEFEGKRFNSPNDIVISSRGDVYFTDPPYGSSAQERQLGFSGVFRITQDGKVTLMSREFTAPNGIALSPDEKKAWVSDSMEKRIRIFDVDAEGRLVNGRIFAELKNDSLKGVPDGMTVDVYGNVYATGPGGVTVFSQDGRVLGRIDTQEASTNVTFGGADFKTIFITAQSKVYSIQAKVSGLKPGFRCRQQI